MIYDKNVYNRKLQDIILLLKINEFPSVGFEICGQTLEKVPDVSLEQGLSITQISSDVVLILDHQSNIRFICIGKKRRGKMIVDTYHLIHQRNDVDILLKVLDDI